MPGAGELRSRVKEDFRCKKSSEDHRTRDWGSDMCMKQSGVTGVSPVCLHYSSCSKLRLLDPFGGPKMFEIMTITDWGCAG